MELYDYSPDAGEISKTMHSECFSFSDFRIDLQNRRLTRTGAPIELNGRYFDALVLLVGARGGLVSKDRFMSEVWRGVPVTDEALTQCIRSLRRALGDDAGRPRFIETVPKHGYRFIAAVRAGEEGASAVATGAAPLPSAASPWRAAAALGAAGMLGAGLAGVIGGLVYGFTMSGPGMGAASVLLVLLCLTVALTLIGGAGVSFGIALAEAWKGRAGGWTMLGGAAGGLIVGAMVKLIGLDAFTLLLGHAPAGMTGAGEGALLGASVGLGAWIGRRAASLRRGAGMAALIGGVTGLLIPLFGGRLLGGSLDLLAAQFAGSRLRLDGIGALFGESGFGQVSQAATGALEGALFAGCIIAAMMVAERWR